MEPETYWLARIGDPNPWVMTDEAGAKAALAAGWQVKKLREVLPGEAGATARPWSDTDPLPPVQQIINTRRQFEDWASGRVSAPPYEELLTAAVTAVVLLAGWATANVEHAYRAGLAINLGRDAAAQLHLQGLDVLHRVYTAEQVPDGSAVIEAVEEALRYRTRGLEEIAQGAAVAAVTAADLARVQELAQRYEQGPVGPQVPPEVAL